MCFKNHYINYHRNNFIKYYSSSSIEIGKKNSKFSYNVGSNLIKHNIVYKLYEYLHYLKEKPHNQYLYIYIYGKILPQCTKALILGIKFTFCKHRLNNFIHKVYVNNETMINII